MINLMKKFNWMLAVLLLCISSQAIDIVIVYNWKLKGQEFLSEDRGDSYKNQYLKKNGYVAVAFDTNTGEYGESQILEYWQENGNKWVTQGDFANGHAVFNTRTLTNNKQDVVVTGFNNNDSAEEYCGRVSQVRLATIGGQRAVNIGRRLSGQYNWNYSIYNRIFKKGYGAVNLSLNKKATDNANTSGQKVEDVMRDLKNSITAKGYLNQEPIALDDLVSVEMNTDDLTITVLSNDYDPQNAQLQVDAQLLSLPSHGAASVNTNDSTISYTPDYDWFGIDQFSYRVTNQFGSSDTATVTVSVVYNRICQRVSLSSSGKEGTKSSWQSCITRDGRYVVFMSDDSTLGGGSLTVKNIYRYDRGRVNQSDVISMVNYNETDKPNMGDQSIAINGKVISNDGANVVFSSGANNLLDYLGTNDTNSVDDIFLRNITMTTQQPTADYMYDTMIEVTPEGSIAVTNNSTSIDTITYILRPSTSNPDWQPSSSTGWVGESSETIGGGQTIEIPINFQTTGPPGPTNGLSRGTYFVNLEVFDDSNNVVVNEYRIQLNVSAKPIVRVSEDAAGAEANGASFGATLSEDSSHVAFYSEANNLVNNDTNGKKDVFVKNTQTDGIVRVSVSTNSVEGDGDSINPSISPDEAYVVFESKSTNLIDNTTLNGNWQVFIHDLATSRTTLVSRNTVGAEGDGDSHFATIEYDVASNKYYVVYSSTSTNLDTKVTPNGVYNVFLYDVTANSNTCVSVSNSGESGNGDSVYPELTGDGLYVVFESEAANIVSGDSNARSDIFLRNIVAGATSILTRNDQGDPGNGGANYPSVGTDSNYLYTSFSSDSTNLVTGDSNEVSDVFVVKGKDLNN